MKNKFLKILSVFLVCVFLLGLVSCESRAITSTKQAKRAVGTVGGYEVTYEELYFVVSNYKAHLDSKYGDEAGSDEYINELNELVYENIVANYAVLTLAAEEGMSLDDEGMKDEIQASVDAYIQSNFEGDRSDYKKSMKENGLTDNYVRFSFGVDILYSKLVSEYLSSGVINDDDDYVREKIKNEFARSWHVMIIDDGSDECKQKAEEALAMVESGTSMYKMIGSKYNDDFNLTTFDGYYFPKGVMDKAYEDAVFALEVGEKSGLVYAKGEDYYGNAVDCYYIIERLEIEDSYVEKNFATLKTSYYTAEVYSMVSELEESLKFVPNEFYKSLDLTSLAAPKTVDYVIVVAVVGILVAVLAVALVAVALIVKIRRRNADVLSGHTNRELREIKNKK